MKELDRVIAHTPPNRFPQLESLKRPESLSYSAPVQKQEICSYRRLPFLRALPKVLPPIKKQHSIRALLQKREVENIRNLFSLL
jgi:hypothetical protein